MVVVAGLRITIPQLNLLDASGERQFWQSASLDDHALKEIPKCLVPYHTKFRFSSLYNQ